MTWDGRACRLVLGRVATAEGKGGAAWPPPAWGGVVAAGTACTTCLSAVGRWWPCCPSREGALMPTWSEPA